MLKQEIPWETYSSLLSEGDLQRIKNFDKATPEVQSELLTGATGAAYAASFLTVLRNISKEDTVQYALALVHQFLEGSLPPPYDSIY